MRKLHCLTDLVYFLDSIHKKPNKRLSQNFLIDKNIVDKILKQADVHENDLVLEIGPGPGVLTEALIEKKAHVFAVEKDQDFAKALSRIDENIHVFHQDILDFDFSILKKLAKTKKMKVIANLPYHIATKILLLLVEHHDLFSSFTVMLQKEQALRSKLSSSSKDFRAFSLLLQYYTQLQVPFSVSKTCFYPKPHVDSAILYGKIKKDLPVENQCEFISFVETLFQQKRKQIYSRLQKLFPQKPVAIFLENLSVDKKERIQNLTGEKLYALFCLLK